MGKINIENLRTPSTEQAREMQKKLIRRVIEERLGGADLEEIVDNLIDRAKHDSKDFEVLQSALGQKPADKVQMKTDVNIADSAERLSNIFEQIKDEK